MKKSLLAAALVALAAGCSPWPGAREDVRELRALHKVYRDHTVAKSATQAAQVEELGLRIDNILMKAEGLTR